MSGSPRPTFDRPTAIPFDRATRHVWGDEQAGKVDDWIYVSSARIHQLVFGLAPGASFHHSESHRTVFAADEIYYVLEGVLAIANPANGEVHRVLPGEAAFFRRDTWHHGFSCGSEPLRVLELFAPPPSQGTSSAYAKTQSYLERGAWRFGHEAWLGRWPMQQASARAQASITVLREADLLWRMVGREQPLLTGLFASTEHLTVGRCTLLPGQQSDFEVHGGDESLYVLEGELRVELEPGAASTGVAAALDGALGVLRKRDGAFLPMGTRHRYVNAGNSPVTLLFGVAPEYELGDPASARGGAA